MHRSTAAALLVAITLSLVAPMAATGPATAEGHVVEIHDPDDGPAWVVLQDDYPGGDTVRVDVAGASMDRFWDAYWSGERVSVERASGGVVG